MEEQLFNILKLLVSLDTDELDTHHFIITDDDWVVKLYKTEHKIKISVLYEQFPIITITVLLNTHDNIKIYTINNYHVITSLNDFDTDIVSFTLINGRILTQISRYMIASFFLDYEFLKQSLEEFLSNNEHFRRTIT